VKKVNPNFDLLNLREKKPRTGISMGVVSKNGIEVSSNKYKELVTLDPDLGGRGVADPDFFLQEDSKRKFLLTP
jgi:hypothetical protein